MAKRGPNGEKWGEVVPTICTHMDCDLRCEFGKPWPEGCKLEDWTDPAPEPGAKVCGDDSKNEYCEHWQECWPNVIVGGRPETCPLDAPDCDTGSPSPADDVSEEFVRRREIDPEIINRTPIAPEIVRAYEYVKAIAEGKKILVRELNSDDAKRILGWDAPTQSPAPAEGKLLPEVRVIGDNDWGWAIASNPIKSLTRAQADRAVRIINWARNLSDDHGYMVSAARIRRIMEGKE